MDPWVAYWTWKKQRREGRETICPLHLIMHTIHIYREEKLCAKWTTDSVITVHLVELSMQMVASLLMITFLTWPVYMKTYSTCKLVNEGVFYSSTGWQLALGWVHSKDVEMDCEPPRFSIQKQWAPSLGHKLKNKGEVTWSSLWELGYICFAKAFAIEKWAIECQVPVWSLLRSFDETSQDEGEIPPGSAKLLRRIILTPPHENGQLSKMIVTVDEGDNLEEKKESLCMQPLKRLHDKKGFFSPYPKRKSLLAVMKTNRY